MGTATRAHGHEPGVTKQDAGPAAAPRSNSLTSDQAQDGAFAESNQRTARWRASLTMALVVLTGLVGAFWEVGGGIGTASDAWSSYGHIVLIGTISGYLIWSRTSALAALTPRAEPGGVLAMGLICAVWLANGNADAPLLKAALLIALMNAVVFATFGRHVYRQILFPMLFLFFAVPMEGVITAPMQHLTAASVVSLLEVSGVPVYLEHLIIHIPSGNFVVSETCSGAPFLISTVALGCLASSVLYRSWARRIAFLALCVAVPIAANAIRAYLTIMIADGSDYTLGVGADHLIYGWVFLSCVTVALLAVGIACRERPVEPTHGPDSARRSPIPLISPKAFVVMAFLLLVAAPMDAATQDSTHVPAPVRDRDAVGVSRLTFDESIAIQEE